MTDENTSISPEAFERVKSERDALKAKVSDYERQVKDAGAALQDFAVIDKAYDHFAAKSVPNAYGLAKEAILNPKVKTADPETLGEALDGWYDRARSIFGATTEPAKPAEPEPAPAPKAPMSQPVPNAPGTPAIGGVPLVVGSAEFEAKFGHMPLAEQAAAVKRGEAVFSPEAATAMKSMR